jgi:hypothetical protein
MPHGRLDEHQPIEPEHRAMLRELARRLDLIFNDGLPEKRHGFVLLMFQFGDDPFSRMNYISNAKREDMLKAMREWLDNAERHARGDMQEAERGLDR